MKNLTLSQAIEGFLLEKEAQRLSPCTVKDYDSAFRRLQAFLGDPVFADITLDQLRAFMADLAKPGQPGGIAPRPVMVLSIKTMLNVHTALSALRTWAGAEGLTKRYLLRPAGAAQRQSPHRRHPDPPDCDAALMGQIADRVVTLSDLRGLANVLTMLVPRTQVA